MSREGRGGEGEARDERGDMRQGQGRPEAREGRFINKDAAMKGGGRGGKGRGGE